MTGAGLAARINDRCEQLSGERPGLSDPLQAGLRLGALLGAAAEPALLVVDDVYSAEQLEPFLAGGRSCRRLVTTRLRRLAGHSRRSVQVDQLS